MSFVWIELWSYCYLIFSSADYIFALLRAIIHILNPNAANYSQKPRPIPSLPPVTTAHDLYPYLYLNFLAGKIALMILQSSLDIQMMNTMPPTVAKK